MTPSRRLWIARPKGWFGWGYLILGCLLCGLSAPRQATPQSLLGMLGIVVLPLVLLLTVPVPWLIRWEQAPRWLRCPCLMGFAYVIVVSGLNASELYTFPVWGEFLLPGGLTPWSPTNSAGFVAGLAAFASQDYRLVSGATLPPDAEILVRGPVFIHFDEARRQAAALNAEPSDVPKIPTVEDPSRN